MTAGFCGVLAACSGGASLLPSLTQTLAVAPSPKAAEVGEAVPGGGGPDQVGKPYEVADKQYAPEDDPDYDRTGVASWYGTAFHGRLTANGEIFDRTALSAAHPTLPLPSYVRVTNLENDRSVIVRVNDRGPYTDGRLIDVSEQTAALLAFRRDGLTRVRIQYVSPAPAEGEDEPALLASYRGPGGAPMTQPGVMLALVEPGASVPGPAVAHAPTPAASASAVAFAADEAQGPAGAAAAMQSLTASYAAGERIQMVFQLVSEIDE